LFVGEREASHLRSPPSVGAFPLAFKATYGDFCLQAFRLLKFLILLVLQLMEVVNWVFLILLQQFFFPVVFLLQAVISRCWFVKNGGCWWIFGGDMFQVRSFILGWILSDKNYLGAVAGLFWSRWSLNEAVWFVSGRCVTHTRRRFRSSVLCACRL
jgi:hypothetical protein